MRAISSSSIITVVLAVSACTNAEEAGRKAAQEKAAEETKREVAATAAVKVNPPVPGRRKIPCEQLIDPAKFQEALAEIEPMRVRDETQVDMDAAAVCGLLRGGVRPDQKQQGEIIKKNGGRLGTLPGDELCSVTAYCWTIEEDAKFRDRCKTQGFNGDETMGTWACLQVVAQGADDVNVYKFLDDDTKCVLKVRGGPSMVDNDVILRCAKAARDYIGKPEIEVRSDAPNGFTSAPAGSAGSGSGAAPGSGSATP
jgi:hypothetical protein